MTNPFKDVRLGELETAESERVEPSARFVAGVNTPAACYGLEALLGHKL
jgi:hypothetical protein